MDKEIKEMLNVIVAMVEEVGKKVDRLECEMQEMKTEMREMKTEQANMNKKLDALSSMYGRHEVAIQVLEKKKII